MNLLFSKLLKLTGISPLETSPDNNSQNSNEKQKLEKDMQHALENEAFEIYYQPQVNTDGVIHAAEALLRWNHPERGFISPGEFIPLAEENLLINPLTDWVIKQVCSQLRDWKDKGLAVRPISINLSPIRLMEGGLVELVKQQLELFSIPATLLEVEITENSLVKFDGNVLATLDGLKELGIRIALDDFGTGYSSAGFFTEFHADILKIDQVFIKNMDVTNKKDAAIVTSIIHLAKGLDMKIVAEGVEEYEQFQFLKDKDCDYIQGYLFSKPVPAAMYEKLLRVGSINLEGNADNSTACLARRKYYRFDFSFSVLGEMTVTEVNKKKVNVGTTDILITDISLGGIKVQSNLKLPKNPDVKFRFLFTMMGEPFDVEGRLRWKQSANGNTYYYGFEFDLTPNDDDRLAPIIHKMSALKSQNKEIPGTEFVYENSNLFFRKLA